MQEPQAIVIIFFFYGLAFFSMGIAIVIELGHATDVRLRRALRPLAVFGLIHGLHEWSEMLQIILLSIGVDEISLIWEGFDLGILAFSFMTLAAFGAFMIAKDDQNQRLSLLIPLLLAAIWAFGILIFRDSYPAEDIYNVADVWTRYTLAIPAALIAAVGLISQQREFRRMGLPAFGQDCLWAAVAFIWYGFIGQVFTRASLLPPSDVINQELFIELFGFPVQLLRAVSALVAAIFVIRFMRSFEYEIRTKISSLQEARIKESQQREEMHSEMLRRIVAAQEAERRRVARELHDATGQSLTAIGLGLRGASSMVGKDDKKASQNLQSLEELVGDALNELQHLIADLRPSHLDDLGLAAALRWYAGEIQSRVPLQVHVDTNGCSVSLPTETKTAIFRIVQEALTNVIKHANANNAFIYFACDGEIVHVIVEDDGDGFNPENMFNPDRPTWGLIGMKERTALLDGNFNISTNPGSGTKIEIQIPYREEEDNPK